MAYHCIQELNAPLQLSPGVAILSEEQSSYWLLFTDTAVVSFWRTENIRAILRTFRIWNLESPIFKKKKQLIIRNCDSRVAKNLIGSRFCISFCYLRKSSFIKIATNMEMLPTYTNQKLSIGYTAYRLQVISRVRAHSFHPAGISQLIRR